MKTCKRCGETKPLSLYQPHPTGKDGHCSLCTPCRKERDKEYAQKRREAGKFKFSNRERQSSHLKFRYGITVDEYDRMHEMQDGCCMICGGSCGSGRRLAVDHNHTTGKVRGLLCSNCNTLLGKAKDNVNILQAAIDYLNDFS